MSHSVKWLELHWSCSCRGKDQESKGWEPSICWMLPGAFSAHRSMQKFGKTDCMVSGCWSEWTLQATCLSAHLLWAATGSTGCSPCFRSARRIAHPNTPQLESSCNQATLASETREFTPSSTKRDGRHSGYGPSHGALFSLECAKMSENQRK